MSLIPKTAGSASLAIFKQAIQQLGRLYKVISRIASGFIGKTSFSEKAIGVACFLVSYALVQKFNASKPHKVATPLLKAKPTAKTPPAQNQSAAKGPATVDPAKPVAINPAQNQSDAEGPVPVDSAEPVAAAPAITEAATRAQLVEARDYLLANRAHLQPVRLHNHNNICFYSTFFQTIMHSMIMEGTFLRDDPASIKAWNVIWNREDLASFKSDIIAYILALREGTEQGASEKLRLEGRLPAIAFGVQHDVLDVMRQLDIPFTAGIEPTAGEHTCHWNMLPISEWFSSGRRDLLLTHKGIDLVRAWLQQHEGADIEICYRGQSESLLNGNPHRIVEAIDAAKVAGLHRDQLVSFTIKAPEMPTEDLEMQTQEERVMHARRHPTLAHPDFEVAMATSLTDAYTHSDAPIWKVGDLERRDAILAEATTLEELRPLFMYKVVPDTAACLASDEWRLVHEDLALLRVRVSDQDAYGEATLRAPEDMTKPRRSFNIKGKHFELVSFTYHRGELGHGHWTSFRREGEQFFKLDDIEGNTPITNEDIDQILAHNGSTYGDQTANTITLSQYTEEELQGFMTSGVMTKEEVDELRKTNDTVYTKEELESIIPQLTSQEEIATIQSLLAYMQPQPYQISELVYRVSDL